MVPPAALTHRREILMPERLFHPASTTQDSRSTGLPPWSSYGETLRAADHAADDRKEWRFHVPDRHDHRDELFDLTMRWMNDDFHPDDGEALTRIFVYESAISALVIERVLGLLGKFGTLRSIRCGSAPSTNCASASSRALECTPPAWTSWRKASTKTPPIFFPSCPWDALVVTDDASRLLALGRVKRMARVAEKVSFRLVEALFKEIQATARRLAKRRATQAGVPLEAFVSSDEAMRNDFVQAEEDVAHSFRDKTIHIGADALTINDILGFKIIAPQETLDRLPSMLGSQPGVTVAEIQEHSGNYNAVNLLLDLDLPPADTLAARLRDADWSGD